MRSIWVAVALLACGGTTKSKSSWTAPDHGKAERTVDRWTVADEDLYIGRACQNIVDEHGNLRCPALEKVGLSAPRCRESFGAMRDGTRDDNERHAFRFTLAGLSLARSCAEVDATFRIAIVQLQSKRQTATADGSGMSCRRRPDGSFDLTAEDMLARRGLGDRVFGETPSTVQSPIQVCGLRGQLEWLTRLTCADGSRPWGKDFQKAHNARTGSTMGYPRCPGDIGNMVDHYKAPCPEKQYDVYIDLYECGPGERLR